MPAPPYSAGTSMPIRPNLPISRMFSSGNSPEASCSAATGAMRFCAKSRAIDWIESWSSVKLKSMCPPVPHRRHGLIEGYDGGNRHGENAYFTFLHKASSRSEEHTSELQSRGHLVCRLLLAKKKGKGRTHRP